MNDRERIGKMIAEIRTGNGLTIRELADIAGVTSTNICNIENGKYSAGVDVLSRILSALGYRLTIEKIEKVG
ncbi:helix-turn-helix domain-containing protein [Bacteroides heparinolyticus]|uniref:helix-turn-helix domain-containing protein n=1 Tax=Prevotella heparinolytica TaxID=28113 RepID=UPI0023EF781D|nr:helix-turn-helix transcriptional regulator [Bacteroides heparinolyticus]